MPEGWSIKELEKASSDGGEWNKIGLVGSLRFGQGAVRVGKGRRASAKGGDGHKVGM